MAGTAKSLFDWRRRHGFCAACGVESENACGGWKRICPACGVTQGMVVTDDEPRFVCLECGFSDGEGADAD